MTILVVEDEEMLRELIVQRLELIVQRLKAEIGPQIIECDSGHSAIKILQNDDTIKFIISDYRMANGDGYELLEYCGKNLIKAKFLLFTSTISPALPQVTENFIGVFCKSDLGLLIQEISDLMKSHLDHR